MARPQLITARIFGGDMLQNFRRLQLAMFNHLAGNTKLQAVVGGGPWDLARLSIHLLGFIMEAKRALI